jgi:regulator of sigma E protease
MNILISIAAFIAAICMLVIWHEFGHYIVMRSFGIKVLRFSIFFGRPLLRWQRNPDSTEIAIGWLPLGGYVKPLDEHDDEVPEYEKHLAFNRQPVSKRFLAVLAGPAFNFIFAIAAYWVIFMIGVPGIRPIIGEVQAGSAAAQAGFVMQDEILAVNGNVTPTWDTALLRLFEGTIQGNNIGILVRTPEDETRLLKLEIKDGRSLTEPGKLLPGLGFSEWQPEAAPEVGQILPNGGAERAGLQKGDLIQRVENTPITSPQQLIDILQSAPNRTLNIVVQRGKRSLNLQLPVGEQKTKNNKLIGYIGALIEYSGSIRKRLDVEQRYNPIDALGHALIRTGSLTWLTLDASWNMVVGKVSLSNLSGPINIAQYAGYTAESGLVPFLAFLAVVSISLGVLNLLPIPVLDGGHLLYYLIEAFKGSPLSIQAELIGQRVGLALLLTLMSFAIYNDLTRMFG